MRAMVKTKPRMDDDMLCSAIGDGWCEVDEREEIY